MGTGEKGAHGSGREPSSFSAGGWRQPSLRIQVIWKAAPTAAETSMPHPALRVGLIGAGANTRSRHIPGLREQENVTLVAVCNRRPASTAAVAREYDIPRTYDRWQDLVADSAVDAVVIGTWPYLHCPITLAA